MSDRYPVHLLGCYKWGDDEDIERCTCGLEEAESAGEATLAAWVAANGDGYADDDELAEAAQ